MKVKSSGGVVVLFFTLIMLISMVSAFNWDDNIQAYYEFEQTVGDLVDSTGVNNSVVASATRGVSGKIGNAFEYDGLNDYVGTGVVLPVNNITINQWVKPDIKTNGGTIGNPIDVSGSTDGIQMLWTDNTTLRVTRRGVFNLDVPYPDNLDFHMVTSIYNSSGMYVYIDGVLTNSSTSSAAKTDFNSGTPFVSTMQLGGFIFSGGVNNDYDGVIDEVGVWNKSLTPTDITELYNSGSGLAYGISDVVVLNTPVNNSLLLVGNINFTTILEISEGVSTLQNVTYYVWKSGILSNSTLIDLISLNTNATNSSLVMNSFTVGDYEWNVLAGYSNATSNNSVWAPKNFTFTVDDVIMNTQTFNANTTQTQNESFVINISYDATLYPTPTVFLEYNGTNYTTTKAGAGNSFTFTRVMDIPATALETTSFRWIFTSGAKQVTNTSSQYVTELIWTICNATYSDDFLNISFKDETDLSETNASVPFSTFTYYLGTGTVTKSYTLTDLDNNANYTFCASPVTEPIKVLPSFQYKQNATYPQRIWTPAVQTYTNTSTNQILYLLKSTVGADVTFQVLNPTNQPLTGVEVSASRLISGVLTVVADGTTDAAGAVTFFLDGTFEHTFSFSKTGFVTQSQVLFPDQTSYTVVMASSTSSPVDDLTKGITISILPLSNAVLFNGTIYNFNLTMASTFWDLDSFGFTLELPNGTVLGTVTSSASNGGTVSINLNTLNYSVIVLKSTYTINGSTVTGVVRWAVINSNLDDWSIKTFFDDFETYFDSGLFGMDDFGKSLIIFMILFFSVGIVSFKFGFTSPMAVSSMIFGIIYFFDIAVNILPPIAGIPNFLTFVAGLILVAAIFREVTR